MKKDYTKLNAYIDEELSPEELAELQSMLMSDDGMTDELDALVEANEAMGYEFDALLDTDLPEGLIEQIENADLVSPVKKVPVAANSNVAWRSIAASLVMLAVGGVGGYVFNEQTQTDMGTNTGMDNGATMEVASAGGWLKQVADYHGIYAAQKRHLVEVSADESEHIMNWLGNTTGVSFSIPDLLASGFEFQGARLLVVNAKPVAQLLYTDQAGAVVAICFQKGASDMTGMGSKGLEETIINDLNIVSWNDRSANFLVISDVDQADLKDIAETTKLNI